MDTVLFWLLPNGQFNSTFGKNRVVRVAPLAFVSEAYDIAVQGKNLIIFGYGQDASNSTCIAHDFLDMAVTVFDPTSRRIGPRSSLLHQVGTSSLGAHPVILQLV